MKVYVLVERIYNYDSGEENTSYIDGVYNAKQNGFDGEITAQDLKNTCVFSK